jgi:anti-anti-sigma regulatory factor
MLRISTSEDEQVVAIRLEGRVAGPWVDELAGAWKAVAPRVAEKKLQLDLRGVTFADDSGKRVLREIYAQSGAEIVAKTAWSDYLAEEIRSNPTSDIA